MQYSTIAITLFAGFAAAQGVSNTSSSSGKPSVSAPAGSPDSSDCPDDNINTLNQCLQNLVVDVRFSANCIKDGANDYTCLCSRTKEQQTCYRNSCPGGGGVQSLGAQATQYCPLATTTSVAPKSKATGSSNNAGSEDSATTASGTAGSATSTESAASASSSASGAEALSVSYALFVAPIVAYFAM